MDETKAGDFTFSYLLSKGHTDLTSNQIFLMQNFIWSLKIPIQEAFDLRQV